MFTGFIFGVIVGLGVSVLCCTAVIDTTHALVVELKIRNALLMGRLRESLVAERLGE